MGIIITGIVVAVVGFIDYCCCRAASLSERRRESSLMHYQDAGGNVR